METCTHYKRGCDLLAPCCQTFFPCRFCHDEVKYDKVTNPKLAHKIDRHAVRQVKCRSCGTVQAPQLKCQHCEAVFGVYFCPICVFIDNDPAKQIYHCDGCGICRIGVREDYFHCSTCEGCFGIATQGTSHACREGMMRSQCAVCLDELFSSTRESQPTKCGHYMHSDCLKEMLKAGHYKCPLCNKAVVNLTSYYADLEAEIAHVPMPEEYREMKVDILCNDCNLRSNVSFHVLGLKCDHCSSFNTART